MRASRAMLALLLGVAVAGCGARRAGKLRVIATTTHLSELAEEIGGDQVVVTTVIPPGGCPGHYDLRTQDMQAAARGGLLLRHGWETFTDRMVAAAGTSRLKVVTIREQGNLMLPPVRARAAVEVGDALASADAKSANRYRERARELAAEIASEGRAVMQQANVRRLRGMPAIATDQQAPFLRWLGMDVVAEYGRAEDLSPQTLHKVMAAARRAKVRLVVDNLQSGPDTGRAMARELGVVHFILSNFPGASADAPDWQSTLRANVATLLRVVGK
jgi:zinc transport system substrate-binding protein